MTDNFSEFITGLGDPLESGAAITPHDTNDLANTTRAIYVGVTGDIKVDLLGTGTAVVFTAVPVGLYWLRCTRIYATDTDATNIVGLW